MVDFEKLKNRLNLLIEIEKDLGPGKKSGSWVKFSCPFPGHKHGDKKPALSVKDDYYFCFVCKAEGNVITWLREYRKLTWKDIFSLADGDNLPQEQPKPRSDPQPEEDLPPSPAWQVRGLAFVEYCERQLWGDPGSQAKIYGDLSPLEYLRQKRGLTDETIKRYRLGYNPRLLCDQVAPWGLPDDSESKGVWMAQGITVPCLVENNLWSVNIRRPLGDPKYQKLKGSKAALFGADNLLGAEIALLTEGEFDCILASQVIGDVAGVATLGSATKRLNVASWGRYLLPARAILAAYDLDEAGRRGLADLVNQSPQIYPVRVPALRPGDNDLTDYHQAGGELWEWLKYNLERLNILQALGIPIVWQGASAPVRQTALVCS